jgi:hypothetical protein
MCGASTPNIKSPTSIPEHPHFITTQQPTTITHHPTPSIKVCGFFKLSVPLQDKTINR